MAPRGDDTMSTQAAHKYGSSAVRDISYVTGSKTPYVQVKQRQNGQYVVVERLPVHHKPRNHGLPTLQQSLAESEVKLNSLKPGWMPTPKVRENYKPYRNPIPALPPINLGYKDKANPMVGSLDNVRHEPGGGRTAIFNEKVTWDARPKVGSLDNIDYNKGPGRGLTTKSDPGSSGRISDMLGRSPRYGALAASGALGPSMHYTPGGGEVFNKPNRFRNVRPRVGSLENIGHTPGGGDVMVEHRPTRWRSDARIGSLDNVHHVPRGGDISIPNQRVEWQARPKIGSLDNVTHRPEPSAVSIPKNKVSWLGRSRVGSLENIHHRPGGGTVHIVNNRIRWKAQPRIDNKPPRRMSHGSSLDSLDSTCKNQTTRIVG